jgi:hypothetical protein
MMITSSAAVANRSALNLAVFSRTAMMLASYSAAAFAPSRARSSFLLKLASARARASCETSLDLPINRASLSDNLSLKCGVLRDKIKTPIPWPGSQCSVGMGRLAGFNAPRMPDRAGGDLFGVRAGAANRPPSAGLLQHGADTPVKQTRGRRNRHGAGIAEATRRIHQVGIDDIGREQWRHNRSHPQPSNALRASSRPCSTRTTSTYASWRAQRSYVESNLSIQDQSTRQPSSANSQSYRQRPVRNARQAPSHPI